MLSYAKVFKENPICFLVVGTLLAVRQFSTELRSQMSHEELAKSTVAHHVLGLARITKAIEKYNLTVHFTTLIVDFMAEGNTCTVLFGQLPRLNLPTIFERNLRYRLWVVVGLQQVPACSTKHGTEIPKTDAFFNRGGKA